MTSFRKLLWHLALVMCEKLYLAFANDIKSVSGGSLSEDIVALGVMHLKRAHRKRIGAE